MFHFLMTPLQISKKIDYEGNIVLQYFTIET